MRVSKVFKYDPVFESDNTGDPDLEAAKAQLFDDFKHYLLSGQHLGIKFTGIFGRDALYDHPNTPASVKIAKLRHVHVLPLSAVPLRLRGTKYHKTSDVHLVYCIDDIKGHACAIALLKPAHELANNSLFLSQLAAIAEQFFNRS